MSYVRTSVLTVVDRKMICLTASEVGFGRSSVLRKLIDKIGENSLKIVCTDGNFSPEEELGMNADIKHLISKSETCLIESYNSVLCY